MFQALKRKGMTVLFIFGFLLTMIPAPTSAASNLLFGGEQQTYSVIFRETGEAIVFARLVFNNTEATPKTEVMFGVGDATISDFVAYQQILPPACVEYDRPRPPRTCLTYGDPNYARGGASPDGESQYLPVTSSVNSGTYILQLPTAIEPDKSGAILLAYTSRSYTDRHWGNYYTYHFQTLQADERVTNVRVSVGVDSELVLKGDRSRINYLEDLPLDDVESTAALSTDEFDELSSRIGTGSLAKSATNMAAGETLEVRGAYGPTWLRVHVASFFCAVVIVGGLILLAYALVHFGRKYKRTHHLATATNASVRRHLLNDVIYVIVGLTSSALAIATTAILNYLQQETRFMRSLFDEDAIAVIAVITIAMFYALVLLGPGILMAVKRGWKALLFTVMAEFAWLVVFLIIYLGFFKVY